MSASTSTRTPAQLLVDSIRIFNPNNAKSFRQLSETKSEKAAEAASTKYENKSHESLQRVCDTAQIAYNSYASGNLTKARYDTLLKKASDHERSVLEWAYSGDMDVDYFPVYGPNIARDVLSKLAKNPDGTPDFRNMSAAMKSMMLSFLEAVPSIMQPDKRDEFRQQLEAGGLQWDPKLVPSQHSTPLAQFRKEYTQPASATSTVQTLLQARCEITCNASYSPQGIALCNDILATIGRTGYKERDPGFSMYRISESGFRGKSFECGLLEIPTHLIMDPARNLTWLADQHRIKSFSFESDEDGANGSVTPVHTFESSSYRGPMAIVGSGSRLIRHGTRDIGIWDLASAETHGPDGENLIGEALDMEDIGSWREDLDDVEVSSGTPATTTLVVSEDVRKAGIQTWSAHPQSGTSMLCGAKEEYRMFELDLETGGMKNLWLGHAAYPSSISTCAALPNMFVTSATDGAVRMYDVRQPTPTLVCYEGPHNILSAIFVAPDGIPMIFSGGEDTERIMLWDVRAQASVYELSTGNNAVGSLAWDERHSTLYAATHCEGLDRMGYHNDYRRYKSPKRGDKMEEDKHNDEEFDVDDDDDDEYYGRAWPSRAKHDETSFGYGHDAGDHMIYRYAFKENADISILPAYGRAEIRNQGYDW